MNRSLKVIASGFLSGYWEPYPALSGTFVGWLAALLLRHFAPTAFPIATILLIALAIWTSGRAETTWGRDSRRIVIDEWAGIWVLLNLVPGGALFAVLGFLVFRVLDDAKLFPARLVERASGGWGVVLDDVVAGLQGGLALMGVGALLSKFGG